MTTLRTMVAILAIAGTVTGTAWAAKAEAAKKSTAASRPSTKASAGVDSKKTKPATRSTRSAAGVKASADDGKAAQTAAGQDAAEHVGA